MLQYFFLVSMLVGFMFMIVASYSGYKLIYYIQKHHPDKAKDFGCSKRGWFNTFKFDRALYKQHDINDSELIRLQKRTRSAIKWMFIAILPILLFFFFLIVAVVYHELHDLL